MKQNYLFYHKILTGLLYPKGKGSPNHTHVVLYPKGQRTKRTGDQSRGESAWDIPPLTGVLKTFQTTNSVTHP